MQINLKKTLFISAAVLGMLAGGSALSANASSNANANNRVSGRVETVKPQYTNHKMIRHSHMKMHRSAKPMNMNMSMAKGGHWYRKYNNALEHDTKKQANNEFKTRAHLNYYGNGSKGYVIPNPGRTDDATTGLEAPVTSKRPLNRLNGSYNIWSKPGYFTRKGRYVPRGVEIITRHGARQLALTQMPFRGIRYADHHAIMEVSSAEYRGWIPVDGLYGYSGVEGRLPIYIPTKTMKGAAAPANWKQIKHPKFRRGERVIVLANHMKGMYGARGKVDAAYNAKLYMVNYRSTVNHKLVRDHKWVLGREIKANKKGRLHVGEKVTLKANHMKGMYNAKARIVGIHHGPAYMIDYTPTNSYNVRVANHRWVAQSELEK